MGKDREAHLSYYNSAYNMVETRPTTTRPIRQFNTSCAIAVQQFL